MIIWGLLWLRNQHIFQKIFQSFTSDYRACACDGSRIKEGTTHCLHVHQTQSVTATAMDQRNCKSVFFQFEVVFIFSQFDWICCNGPRGVCVCVCLSVCVSVCVISTAQTDGPILMKLSTNHLQHICSIRFSPILKIQIWWRHGGHYCCFRFGHSHGRNFAPIFFKF